jgi:thiol-disulfide isomerase/thioredoxin
MNEIFLILTLVSILAVLFIRVIITDIMSKKTIKKLNADTIPNRIIKIRGKIEKLSELKNLALHINDGKEEEVTKQQGIVIQYLTKYYEEYNMAVFSDNVKNIIDRNISNYNFKTDDSELYSRLNSDINSEYNNYNDDPLLKDSPKLLKLKNEYIQEIKTILFDLITEKTKNILAEISPIEDKNIILEKMEVEINKRIDKDQLNYEYDRFMAEQTIENK